jgi:hypothetical protein
VRRFLLYSALWLVTVAVATGIAVAAISAVGEAARGRGPLGQAIEPLPANGPEPDVVDVPAPDGTEVRQTIRGPYGAFVVSCRGPYAVGEEVRPARAGGWRTLSFEPGPDDDVDAIFANRRGTVEIEVFCDQGRPTVGDIERSMLTR